MRYVFLICIFSYLATVSNAQIKSSFIFPFDYNSISRLDLNGLKDDILGFHYRSSTNKRYKKQEFDETGCDDGPCKSGVYRKIKIKDEQGVHYYAVGKIVREKSKSDIDYCFWGPIEIYYEENDQLFVKGEYTGSGHNPKIAPSWSWLRPTNGKIEMFWPNGNYKYVYLHIKDELTQKKIVRIKKYSEEGELMADFETTGYDTYPFPVRFDRSTYSTKYDFGYWKTSMAHDMVQPGLINHGVNGSYMGFRYCGTYATPEGVSMTGYTWPMVESMGNGSVVYVEDQTGGQPYYSIYFNGKLDTNYRIKAPTITPIDFVFSIDTTTNRNITQSKRTVNYQVDPQPLVNLQTDGIENYSGYGIDYTSNTNLNDTYSRNMRIGFFKNGKLDGLGYRAEVTQNFRDNVHTYQIVSYQYGFFKNDTLVKGETHNGQGLGWCDNWVRPSNPNIQYSSKGPKPADYIYQANAVSFSSLVPNTTRIYLKSVNRYFVLVKVDPKTKKVIVQGSAKEGLITIGENDAAYLYKQITPSTHNEECYICSGKGAVLEVGFKTEYEPGGFVQEGLYYTYYYSYRKAVKKKYYYDILCPRCEGKGRIDVKNVNIQYSLHPILF